jgi:glycosyltransferase involved in cell wall biosynthesis
MSRKDPRLAAQGSTPAGPAGQRPLKIAIVTSFPVDPGSPRGGVEAVSVTLAAALANFPDLELHVVTGDPASSVPSRTSWHAATIHRLPWRGRHMLTAAIGPMRRQIADYVMALSPDVIHAHDIYGLMVQGLPVPRVLTIHGFIYGDTLVSGQSWAWVRSRLWRHFEIAGWADQPHIVSISPYVRERLAGIATGVIHDIDNPIAESFFHLARREQKGRVFSAAAICQRKNTLVLIEAFAGLVRAGVATTLRLAGPVTEAVYGERVRDRIRAHRLDDRVVLLGQISSAQVGDELTTASVFALVSLEENSPLGIEEAMAAGVPVVTSNRCGMPYMVRDGETGFLVNPNDPSNIAEQLSELLTDDACRAAMGIRSRDLARDRFHPERVAHRTRDVYHRAARKP